MVASTHLAVGAAVGLAVQECLSPDASDPERLFWAFTAGFFSHIVLDAIPHEEYLIEGRRLWLVILAEMGIVFALTLSLQNSLALNLLIFLGMVGGALPDVIELTYSHILNWSWLNSLGKIIHSYHYSRTYSNLMFSFYAQFILVIFAIMFVRSKHV